jgi:hypothetical protein
MIAEFYITTKNGQELAGVLKQNGEWSGDKILGDSIKAENTPFDKLPEVYNGAYLRAALVPDNRSELLSALEKLGKTVKTEDDTYGDVEATADLALTQAITAGGPGSGRLWRTLTSSNISFAQSKNSVSKLLTNRKERT